MRRLFVLLVVLGITAVPALAQSISGSKHDLRATTGGTPTGTNLTEICVVCHTPHQDTAANAQYPLWNRNLSAVAAYGVYSSPTFDANPPPTDLGGATLGTAAVSNLCLSCHDGTVSVLSMLNLPNAAPGPITPTAIGGRIDATGKIISSANVGTSLSDDHPVNFNYDAALVTADGGLKDPAVAVAGGVRLFNGSLQCASCHNPHNSTNVPFLRVNNSGSALCLTCHNK